MVIYEATPDDDGNYVAEVYARYGHWVTDDAGTATVNTFALVQGTNTTSPMLGVDADNTDTTAEYSGDAVGVSVHRSQGADHQVVTKSGTFTAGVNLTATFGTQPKLKGSVSGFEGDAVGNWHVTLMEQDLAAGGALDGAGTATATGANGTWSAQAYGRDDIASAWVLR